MSINIGQYGFSIIQIETKSVCNMRCDFCPYPLRSDIGEVLPERIVHSILDSLEPDERFEYVCFSQFNEPLMDGRIYDFILYAKSKGLLVLLVTNGMMFKDENVIQRLVDVAPDIVKISLQIVNEDSFRNVRKVNMPFDEYKQGIYRYLQRAEGSNTRVNVDVACNFLSGMRSLKTLVLGTDRGDPSVYNTVNDLKEDVAGFLKGWQDFSSDYQYVSKDVEGFFNNVTVDYRDQAAYSMGKNIFLKIKHFCYGKKLRDFYSVHNGIGCSTRMLGVLASGAVVPCCMAYDNSISLGNINDQALSVILESKKDFLRELRSGEKMPVVCRRCAGAPTRRGVFLKNLKSSLARDH